MATLEDRLALLIAAIGPDMKAKAPLASPAFSGNPTAPTQSPGNNSTRVATTAYVDAAAGGGGGGGLPATLLTKTSAYTAVANDWILADASGGAFTITLPSNPVVGSAVTVQKIDSSANIVTLDPTGSGTIHGDIAGATLESRWTSITVEHQGSDVWMVVSTNASSVPAGPVPYRVVLGAAYGPTATTGSYLNITGYTLTFTPASNGYLMINARMRINSTSTTNVYTRVAISPAVVAGATSIDASLENHIGRAGYAHVGVFELAAGVTYTLQGQVYNSGVGTLTVENASVDTALEALFFPK